MRKLKLQVQMSLDGFVAGPNGELDWMWIGERDNAIQQCVIELARTCDIILMGRKMAPGFVNYWEDVVDNHADSSEIELAKLMVTMRKIVFSRTLTSIKGRNAELENGDVRTIVQGLKKQEGKDIMVYGGADFVSFLISENLVDEYYIFQRPVAIGNGLSIFKDQKIVKLVDTVIFRNGAILKKYLPV